MAFGRRRKEEESAGAHAGAEAPGADSAVEDREAGPWDAAEDTVPELERLDFGALQVPIGPGLEVQVNLEPSEFDAEGNPVNGRIVAITVIAGQSSMQLQVFAAPKRSGIWEEVLKEIRSEITENAQGQIQDAEGPFGPELRAMIPAELTEEMLEQMPEEVREQIPQEIIEQGYAWQPLRFIGVDGPRWFLRALVAGEAAVEENAEAWQPLEDVLAQVVVVRGDQPMPPRDPLALSLPAEAQQAMGEQAEAEEEDDFDPFTPGQHITEVR